MKDLIVANSIPAELVINIDETGPHCTFTGGYTMEEIGSGGPLYACMYRYTLEVCIHQVTSTSIVL